MGDQTTELYLELSETPLRFEAVNQLTNVFFDDSNKDVGNLLNFIYSISECNIQISFVLLRFFA